MRQAFFLEKSEDSFYPEFNINGYNESDFFL